MLIQSLMKAEYDEFLSPRRDVRTVPYWTTAEKFDGWRSRFDFDNESMFFNDFRRSVHINRSGYQDHETS